VWLAAAARVGLDGLRNVLAERLWPVMARETLQLGLKAASARSRLYREHRILAERVREDGGWEVDVEMTPAQLEALCREPGVTRVPAAVPCAVEDRYLQFPPSRERAAG
jgi:hypothetical protein